MIMHLDFAKYLFLKISVKNESIEKSKIYKM